MLSACVKPMPTASPVSPLATPVAQAERTPTPPPIPDGGAIFNPSFERAYTCPENAVCVPHGWNYEAGG